MKHLKDQIRNRCVHFTGLYKNECCAAGVKYEDVKDTSNSRIRAKQLPCFADANLSCEKQRFPNDREVYESAKKIDDHVSKIRKLSDAKKQIVQKHQDQFAVGSMTCPVCKNMLHYTYHGNVNRHVHMICETSDCISVME